MIYMMGGQTPIIVLKEGTSRETGKGALANNIAAAKAVAEAVRTTLGPKGMDKMLVDSMGDVVITNDGATILKEIDVEHPAAKMIIETAKTQDEQCGDGTTSAVVLAGELLKLSEDLVEQNVHPTIITAGFRIAADKAIEILETVSENVTMDDNEILRNIAITSMTGKSAGTLKDYLSEVVVNAVKAVAEEEDGKIVADIDNIKVEKKQGGSIKDTKLIEGLIIDKERAHTSMPKSVTSAKIALVNAALEVKKTEVDAKIQIKSPEQLQNFVDEEARMLKEMVEKVKSSGANVLLCQKGLDDLTEHYLARDGIFAIKRVSGSDMKKLAKATGGKIVSNLDDLVSDDLGNAGKVEQQKIGSDEMTFIMECPKAKAVSIIVRGGTEHVVNEIERGLHDGLSVVATALEDGKVNTGGGSAAIEISQELREFATTVGGREQMAIEAFAQAIEIIPRALAENAGLDQIESLIKLRKAHKKGDKFAGLNLDTGKVMNMREANVIEPLRVGTQAIQSATDVATMILRIDDVIASKSMGGPPPGAGMPPGMGGMPPGMM
jgi:thermosome